MIQIPKLNLNYWLLMVLATTIGEIVGNLISRNFEIGYTMGSVFLISIFLIAVIRINYFQITNRYSYWELIILGNIAGTNIADFVTIEPLNLGTIYGSLLVMAVLSFILLIWKFTSPKSSIDNGLNNTTYFLYWLAILFSSTFGTTFGDLLSNDTPLGALGGTIFLLILLGIIVLLVFKSKISKELCYWLALVIMHPIGATFGNYISKPAGLNFGNIWTSLVLIIFFVVLYLIENSKKETSL